MEFSFSKLEEALGTLFSQSERNYRRVSATDVDDFLADVLKIAKKHNVSVTDVLSAKSALEAERRNDLYVANGDAFDEQIGGIGQLLQSISSAIEGLKPE